jgi:hypothetical protein
MQLDLAQALLLIGYKELGWRDCFDGSPPAEEGHFSLDEGVIKTYH